MGKFMDEIKKCPLCGGESHRFIERIRYEDIRFVYRNVCKVLIPRESAEFIAYLRCNACDLLFFSPAVCGGPELYEQLQKFPWYYLADKAEYHIAKRFVLEKSSVLEVGCGSGKFSAFLPRDSIYDGLEFNEAAINEARECGLRVHRMSIEEFAQTEHSRFDVVCGFQVLEHVECPAKFLEAASRLLKPGGILVLSVPSEDSLMKCEVNNVLNTPPHHVTRWTDIALRSVSGVVGLKLVHLEHEQLSEVNVRPFARAKVLRVLREKLSLRFPLVSRTAASFFVRACLHFIALPVEWYLRLHKSSVVGHAVVAVYEKP
jgi:2-polyprenyl-3-methyl-5-hydroxy-6-metoxy-1,4-benzoquinol methylase